jgi:hypothetical protein
MKAMIAERDGGNDSKISRERSYSNYDLSLSNSSNGATATDSATNGPVSVPKSEPPVLPTQNVSLGTLPSFERKPPEAPHRKMSFDDAALMHQEWKAGSRMSRDDEKPVQPKPFLTLTRDRSQTISTEGRNHLNRSNQGTTIPGPKKIERSLTSVRERFKTVSKSTEKGDSKTREDTNAEETTPTRKKSLGKLFKKSTCNHLNITWLTRRRRKRANYNWPL